MENVFLAMILRREREMARRKEGGDGGVAAAATNATADSAEAAAATLVAIDETLYADTTFTSADSADSAAACNTTDTPVDTSGGVAAKSTTAGATTAATIERRFYLKRRGERGRGKSGAGDRSRVNDAGVQRRQNEAIDGRRGGVRGGKKVRRWHDDKKDHAGIIADQRLGLT